jgi:glutaredoxin
MAKGFFKSKDIAYEEADVATNTVALDEMMAGVHRMSVPNINIDGTWVVGFDRPKIEALLDTRVLNSEA